MPNSRRLENSPFRHPDTPVHWMLIPAVAILFTPAPAPAQTEGEYLYRVVTLRAAPGHFTDLMTALGESVHLDEETGDRPPFWIRHSQGDQWDFMLIYPMDDFPVYYHSDRATRRAAVWGGSQGGTVASRISEFTSNREEWLARSVPLSAMAVRFGGMGFLHVEMFVGLPGKREALLEQRRMENRYYEHLGRQQNLIFVREGGSNWDAMTIGFYESLQAFAAAGARHSQAEQNVAARAAGFSDVSAISPYLRSLLSYHHDTLGVPVP